MAEESEGSKDSGDLEEGFMPSSHKKAVVALIGIAVVVAGGVYVMNSQPATTQDPVENNAQTDTNSSQETNKLVGLSASQVEGEITEVTFNDIKAEPSSPQISPDDAIRFVNQAGVDVQFSFDREVPDFKLAAGESIIVAPNSIVYYDITPQDENAEFRDISARINVQS